MVQRKADPCNIHNLLPIHNGFKKIPFFKGHGAIQYLQCLAGNVQRGSREINSMIVRNPGSLQRPRTSAGVAAGNVHETERPRHPIVENPVQLAIGFSMEEEVIVDHLPV
ncbi:MAG: hypothetical protein ABL936_12115 [Aestuariivirga sp.]